MEKLIQFKTILPTLLLLLAAQITFAQCKTWNDSPDKGKAEDAHSVYRGLIKSEDYTNAFESWKVAYDIAPAADGGRDFHYSDGIKIYKHKFENETDATKKAEYGKRVLELYDEAIACFEAGVIKMKGGADKRTAFYRSRKVYDMYYTLQTPYVDVITAINDALDKSGNAVEYTVFQPAADIVVYQFSNDEGLTKEEARNIYQKLNDIADHNIANNETYGSYYQQAKDAANGTFAQIENNIFDCDYFVKKLTPTYEANPSDPEVLRNTIAKLKRQGCDGSNAFLTKLEGEYSQYAAAENARRKAEYEANNPDVMARKLRDAGDYNGAIAKYESAIASESDPQKLGLYYYQIAQIKGKKMKSFSAGMAAARKAIEQRPNWGQPHMLIGDLYIQNSKKCGNAFLQKCCYIAAVDKYRKAKSVDPEVAGKAQEKINRYAGTKPEKENAFMQGYSEGQTISLPCIGTSIKLRF